MRYSHVLNRGGLGVRKPLDRPQARWLAGTLTIPCEYVSSTTVSKGAGG